MSEFSLFPPPGRILFFLIKIVTSLSLLSDLLQIRDDLPSPNWLLLMKQAQFFDLKKDFAHGEKPERKAQKSPVELSEPV